MVRKEGGKKLVMVVFTLIEVSKNALRFVWLSSRCASRVICVYHRGVRRGNRCSFSLATL